MFSLGEISGKEKERTLRGEEDGSKQHIYTRRQHDEVHQTLKEEGRERGDGNIMEGMNLFTVHYMSIQNYYSEILSYY
jgi:hypothetical protein